MQKRRYEILLPAKYNDGRAIMHESLDSNQNENPTSEAGD